MLGFTVDWSSRRFPFPGRRGKRIGSSAIRKAHVTELYKSAPTIKQKKEIAEMMNHAPQTAELFYFKPNESAYNLKLLLSTSLLPYIAK